MRRLAGKRHAFSGEFVQYDLIEIDLVAGVVYVDPRDMAVRILIQNNSL